MGLVKMIDWPRMPTRQYVKYNGKGLNPNHRIFLLLMLLMLLLLALLLMYLSLLFESGEEGYVPTPTYRLGRIFGEGGRGQSCQELPGSTAPIPIPLHGGIHGTNLVGALLNLRRAPQLHRPRRPPGVDVDPGRDPPICRGGERQAAEGAGTLRPETLRLNSASHADR